MKKVLLFSVLLLILAPKASAEISEGKSTVNTSVTTNVNSSSNNNNESETKTHIEIEVNGEKKVLDTNEPGTHTLSISKDGGKSSATVKINNNIESSTNSTEKEEGPESALDDDGEIIDEEGKKIIKQEKTAIQKIFDKISELFKNLFSLLR